MANIVVIDDEPLLLGLISTLLRKEGHTVTMFSNPSEGLNSLLADRTPFDLLLTDVDMRPITGFQLVTQLREAGLTGPVLFMSGYQASQGGLASTFADAAVLQKPFTGPELLAAAGKAIKSNRRTCCSSAASPTPL